MIYHHSRQDSYSEQNGKNILNTKNAIFAYFSTFSLLVFIVSQEVDTHLLIQRKLFLCHTTYIIPVPKDSQRTGNYSSLVSNIHSNGSVYDS